jgi:riboflavin synthase alpha subunit
VFTGIVRELGRVVSVAPVAGGVRIVVAAPVTAGSSAEGDSVAVSGVCLTAVAVADGELAFDAVPETLARTTIGGLAPGAGVNLEPALRAGEPLGGHYVQGHVDGTGTVERVSEDAGGRRLRVEAPEELLRYLVEKGSIALDGVSLTVAVLDRRGFEVALIPHTLAATTLGELAAGARVNLELDVLAKYVERLVAPR